LRARILSRAGEATAAACETPRVNPGGEDSLQAGVLDGIVGGAVLPQTPDHPAPGTPEDADRMLMGAAARAREGPERLGGIAVGLSVATTLDDPPIGIVDAHRVLLAGPVNSRKHRTPFDRPGLHAGEEVPWRALIGGALRARLPVAAQGTSTDRRRRWSHAGP